ncbi:methyl-accepting chemotaxis protein [Anaerobacillus sp. MEB173]|uniref:methyl-accepting chemotaxis protein n=1 Tax=Anaerobacillus sp. MEB173 TaxID=3383345 RepID=UPI003F8FAEC1
MKSLRMKILLGFGLVLVLMITLSVINAVTLQNSNKQVEEVVTVEVPRLTDDFHLSFNLSQRTAFARAFLLTGNPYYIEQFDEFTRESEAIENQIRNENRSEELITLINRTTNWVQNVNNEVFAVYNQGNHEQAVTYLIETLEPESRAIMAMYIDRVDKREADVENKGANLVATGKKLQLSSIILTAIAIVVGVLLAMIMANKIVKPILAVVQRVNLIADGDLRGEELVTKSKDEVGQLSQSVNTMVMNLKSLISSVNQATDQVASASEELSASATETTKATEQIAHSVEEVASGADSAAKVSTNSAQSMEEMSLGVQRIAESLTEVANASQESAEEAQTGNERVMNAVKQMENISKSVNESSAIIKQLDKQSKSIEEIVAVITNIASQTNLLALNAAIEAARAGEQGKGFSVVADEVRKLAEQSEQSASQIKDLIQQTKKDTEQSVAAMEEVTKEVISGKQDVSDAGEAFQRINTAAHRVAENVQEVSAISEEMSAYSQEVAASVHEVKVISSEGAEGAQNIAAATEEQLAAMEQISASTNALSEMAIDLQAEVSKFKV